MFSFQRPKMKKSSTETLYFWDGVRKIDLVLAYETEAYGGGTEEEEKKKLQRRERRVYFEKKLQEKGLELELEPSQVGDISFHFGQ